jgi:hypothetical protein
MKLKNLFAILIMFLLLHSHVVELKTIIRASRKIKRFSKNTRKMATKTSKSKFSHGLKRIQRRSRTKEFPKTRNYYKIASLIKHYKINQPSYDSIGFREIQKMVDISYARSTYISCVLLDLQLNKIIDVNKQEDALYIKEFRLNVNDMEDFMNSQTSNSGLKEYRHHCKENTLLYLPDQLIYDVCEIHLKNLNEYFNDSYIKFEIKNNEENTLNYNHKLIAFEIAFHYRDNLGEVCEKVKLKNILKFILFQKNSDKKIFNETDNQIILGENSINKVCRAIYLYKPNMDTGVDVDIDIGVDKVDLQFKQIFKKWGFTKKLCVKKSPFEYYPEFFEILPSSKENEKYDNTPELVKMTSIDYQEYFKVKSTLEYLTKNCLLINIRYQFSKVFDQYKKNSVFYQSHNLELYALGYAKFFCKAKSTKYVIEKYMEIPKLRNYLCNKYNKYKLKLENPKSNKTLDPESSTNVYNEIFKINLIEDLLKNRCQLKNETQEDFVTDPNEEEAYADKKIDKIVEIRDPNPNKLFEINPYVKDNLDIQIGPSYSYVTEATGPIKKISADELFFKRYCIYAWWLREIEKVEKIQDVIPKVEFLKNSTFYKIFTDSNMWALYTKLCNTPKERQKYWSYQLDESRELCSLISNGKPINQETTKNPLIIYLYNTDTDNNTRAYNGCIPWDQYPLTFYKLGFLQTENPDYEYRVSFDNPYSIPQIVASRKFYKKLCFYEHLANDDNIFLEHKDQLKIVGSYSKLHKYFDEVRYFKLFSKNYQKVCGDFFDPEIEEFQLACEIRKNYVDQPFVKFDKIFPGLLEVLNENCDKQNINLNLDFTVNEKDKILFETFSYYIPKNNAASVDIKSNPIDRDIFSYKIERTHIFKDDYKLFIDACLIYKSNKTFFSTENGNKNFYKFLKKIAATVNYYNMPRFFGKFRNELEGFCKLDYQLYKHSNTNVHKKICKKILPQHFTELNLPAKMVTDKLIQDGFYENFCDLSDDDTITSNNATALTPLNTQATPVEQKPEEIKSFWTALKKKYNENKFDTTRAIFAMIAKIFLEICEMYETCNNSFFKTMVDLLMTGNNLIDAYNGCKNHIEPIIQYLGIFDKSQKKAEEFANQQQINKSLKHVVLEYARGFFGENSSEKFNAEKSDLYSAEEICMELKNLSKPYIDGDKSTDDWIQSRLNEIRSTHYHKKDIFEFICNMYTDLFYIYLCQTYKPDYWDNLSLEMKSVYSRWYMKKIHFDIKEEPESSEEYKIFIQEVSILYFKSIKDIGELNCQKLNEKAKPQKGLLDYFQLAVDSLRYLLDTFIKCAKPLLEAKESLNNFVKDVYTKLDQDSKFRYVVLKTAGYVHSAKNKIFRNYSQKEMSSQAIVDKIADEEVQKVVQEKKANDAKIKNAFINILANPRKIGDSYQKMVESKQKIDTGFFRFLYYPENLEKTKEISNDIDLASITKDNVKLLNPNHLYFKKQEVEQINQSTKDCAVSAANLEKEMKIKKQEETREAREALSNSKYFDLVLMNGNFDEMENKYTEIKAELERRKDEVYIGTMTTTLYKPYQHTLKTTYDHLTELQNKLITDLRDEKMKYKLNLQNTFPKSCTDSFYDEILAANLIVPKEGEELTFGENYTNYLLQKEFFKRKKENELEYQNAKKEAEMEWEESGGLIHSEQFEVETPVMMSKEEFVKLKLAGLELQRKINDIPVKFEVFKSEAYEVATLVQKSMKKTGQEMLRNGKIIFDQKFLNGALGTSPEEYKKLQQKYEAYCEKINARLREYKKKMYEKIGQVKKYIDENFPKLGKGEIDRQQMQKALEMVGTFIQTEAGTLKEEGIKYFEEQKQECIKYPGLCSVKVIKTLISIRKMTPGGFALYVVNACLKKTLTHYLKKNIGKLNKKIDENEFLNKHKILKGLAEKSSSILEKDLMKVIESDKKLKAFGLLAKQGLLRYLKKIGQEYMADELKKQIDSQSDALKKTWIVKQIPGCATAIDVISDVLKAKVDVIKDSPDKKAEIKKIFEEFKASKGTRLEELSKKVMRKEADNLQKKVLNNAADYAMESDFIKSLGITDEMIDYVKDDVEKKISKIIEADNPLEEIQKAVTIAKAEYHGINQRLQQKSSEIKRNIEQTYNASRDSVKKALGVVNSKFDKVYDQICKKISNHAKIDYIMQNGRHLKTTVKNSYTQSLEKAKSTINKKIEKLKSDLIDAELNETQIENLKNNLFNVYKEQKDLGFKSTPSTPSSSSHVKQFMKIRFAQVKYTRKLKKFHRYRTEPLSEEIGLNFDIHKENEIIEEIEKNYQMKREKIEADRFVQMMLEHKNVSLEQNKIQNLVETSTKLIFDTFYEGYSSKIKNFIADNSKGFLSKFMSGTSVGLLIKGFIILSRLKDVVISGISMTENLLQSYDKLDSVIFFTDLGNIVVDLIKIFKTAFSDINMKTLQTFASDVLKFGKCAVETMGRMCVWGYGYLRAYHLSDEQMKEKILNEIKQWWHNSTVYKLFQGLAWTANKLGGLVYSICEGFACKVKSGFQMIFNKIPVPEIGKSDKMKKVTDTLEDLNKKFEKWSVEVVNKFYGEWKKLSGKFHNFSKTYIGIKKFKRYYR